MPADGVLSETVVFDLCGRAAGERLWERLRPRWFGNLYECDEGTLVAVQLRSEECDLATLLRTVQFWAHDSGFDTVLFQLDGRTYVLDSKVAIWPSAA
jgi:hypothetical protein